MPSTALRNTAAPRPIILHLCPASIEQQALGETLRRAIEGATVVWVESATAALAQLERGLRPDLLLFLDTAVQDEGLALITHARQIAGELRTAVYGTLGRVDGGRWLEAGCDGLLARDVAPDRFVEALRFILAGNTYVAPQLVASPSDPVNGCAFLGTCGLGSPLLDQIPAPVVLMQGDRYLHLNEAAAALVGYDRAGLLQKNPADIVVEAHRDFIGHALRTWSQGAPVDLELVVGLMHRDGRLIWVSSMHRQTNVGGRPAVLLVCSDVTARLAGQDPARLLAKTPKQLAADLKLTDPSAAAAERTEGGLEGTMADLTARQRQVLDLLAHGASNKRIASQLGISEATAKLHVHRLLRALRARNRAQAVSYGRRLGLVTEAA